MKKMILQMTEAQLLMQVILLVTDLVAEGMGQDIGMQTALILSLIPGALFCIFEFPLRVQNHCKKRWRHVIACLFLWGAVCALFYGLGYAVHGLIPQHEEAEAGKFAFNGGEYYAMPVVSFIFAAVEAAFWFPIVWWGEMRGILMYKIRSYGQEDAPGNEQDDECGT